MRTFYNIDSLLDEESTLPAISDEMEPSNESTDDLDVTVKDDEEGEDEGAEESALFTTLLTSPEDEIFLEVALESAEIDDFLFDNEPFKSTVISRAALAKGGNPDASEKPTHHAPKHAETNDDDIDPDFEDTDDILDGEDDLDGDDDL